ncbi:MAG: hypothetical protein ACOC4C_01875 [Fibrobacterota bacterium]
MAETHTALQSFLQSPEMTESWLFLPDKNLLVDVEDRPFMSTLFQAFVSSSELQAGVSSYMREWDEPYATSRERNFYTGLRIRMLDDGISERFSRHSSSLSQWQQEILRNVLDARQTISRETLIRQMQFLCLTNSIYDSLNSVIEKYYWLGNINSESYLAFNRQMSEWKLKTDGYGKLLKASKDFRLALQKANIENADIAQFTDIMINPAHDYLIPKKMQRKFWDEMNLDLNMRYYYNMSGSHRGSQLTARAGVSIPLDIYQRNPSVESSAEEKMRNRKEALEAIQNYTEATSRVNARRHETQVCNLLYRRSVAQYRNGVASRHIERWISLLSEYTRTIWELIRWREKRYLAVLNLGLFYENGDILSSFEPVETRKPSGLRKGDRKIYIWSRDFNAVDKQFLLDYLTVKEISTALVSYSSNIRTHEWKAFARDAITRNVQTHMIISKSSLLYARNRDMCSGILADVRSSGATGIHIDIEPHTFAAWDSQSADLLKEYISFLAFCRKNYDGTIGAALPVYYPSWALKQIEKYTDYVTIMLYGEVNLRKSEEKLHEEISVFGHDKMNIALRVSDFTNESHLETKIGFLNKRLLVNTFAIHALGDYMNIVGK